MRASPALDAEVLYLPSLEMSGSGPTLRYSFLYPGQCCSIRHGENTDWHQGSTFWEGGGIMKSERKRVEEGCCQRLGSDYQPFLKANRKRSIATAHSVLRSSQMLGWVCTESVYHLKKHPNRHLMHPRKGSADRRMSRPSQQQNSRSSFLSTRLLLIACAFPSPEKRLRPDRLLQGEDSGLPGTPSAFPA